MTLFPEILATRLAIPETPPALLPRSALLERLDQAAAGRLTLLSAPAGYGKSTLLACWAARCRRPVCWVSLDESDNDLSRFFLYLSASLQKVQDGLYDSVSTLLRPLIPVDSADLCSLLINRLDSLEEDFYLVLDDYHLIEKAEIHAAVSMLLAHMPARMHVLLATRADPPFSLARLRAGGRFNELRMSDLSFSLDETRCFLNDLMQLPLSDRHIAALYERSEGWVAGLQMAALSMQGRNDLAQFVNSFTGSHHFILDYLIEEVLLRQSEETQQFLLDTSLLSRLCADLCDSVCQGNASQQRLEALQRANLFLLPLDDNRRWFRYHRLFSSLLQQRLENQYPERLPFLHRRAARWFERNAFYDEAIDHFLAAADFDCAARLLESQAGELLKHGRIQALRTWLDQLPQELFSSRAQLVLPQAWATLLGGDTLESARKALKAIDFPEISTLNTHYQVLQAYIALLEGKPAESGALSRQALDSLPVDESFSREIAVLLDGLAKVFSGHLQDGQQALDELAHLCLKSGNTLMTVITFCNIAEVHLRLARLPQAMRSYRKALECTTDENGQLLPLAGEALCGMGEIYREWNRFEEAEDCLQQGIDLQRRWQQIGMLSAYLSLARLEQARGDSGAALNALDSAWEIALQYEDSTFDDIGVALVRAQIYIQQERLAEALDWVQLRKLEMPDPAELDRQDDFINFHLRKYEYLVAARLFIRQQRFEQASHLLGALLERMPVQGRIRIQLEALMLQALLLQAHGNSQQALQPLQEALQLAQSGGFIRLFVDEGRPMAQLLHEAARRGICSDDCRRLLGEFPPGQCSASPGPALIEPLTPRELEILQMLDSPATNPDIAATLFISPNTVKKHVARILAKTQTENRRQAVAKAKELGLLGNWKR